MNVWKARLVTWFGILARGKQVTVVGWTREMRSLAWGFRHGNCLALYCRISLHWWYALLRLGSTSTGVSTHVDTEVLTKSAFVLGLLRRSFFLCDLEIVVVPSGSLVTQDSFLGGFNSTGVWIPGAAML